MTELEYLEGIYDSVTAIEEFFLGDFIDFYLEQFFVFCTDDVPIFWYFLAAILAVSVLRWIARW